MQSRLQHELKKVPKMQKFWNLIKKKFDKMDADAAELYYIFIYPSINDVIFPASEPLSDLLVLFHPQG